MSDQDAAFWKDSYAGAVAVGRQNRDTIKSLVALLEEFLQFEKVGGNGELDHVARARALVAAHRASRTTAHNPSNTAKPCGCDPHCGRWPHCSCGVDAPTTPNQESVP
jgi:hypothetical protein